VLLRTSTSLVGVKVAVQEVPRQLLADKLESDPVALSILKEAAVDKFEVPEPAVEQVLVPCEKALTGSGKLTVSVAVWFHKSNDLLRLMVGVPLS